jgi:AraC-like DNA-binding protein
MASPQPGAYDRVSERRRAVALARHFREAEGLSIAQIAQRLGRSPSTIKAYFYDPTGEKARAVKARYVGVCRGCGAYTQPRNGKGDAYAYCKRCHPGAIQQRWTRDLVISALLEWRGRFGRLPSSYEGSRTHARRRGEGALRRLAGGDWPSASVVSAMFGTWATARETAETSHGEGRASAACGRGCRAS